MQAIVLKDLETGKMQTVPIDDLKDGIYRPLIAEGKAPKIITRSAPKEKTKVINNHKSPGKKKRPHPGVYFQPSSTNYPWVVNINRKGIKFYKSFKTEQEAIQVSEAKRNEMGGGKAAKAKTPGTKYRCIGCRTVYPKKPKYCGLCNGTKFEEAPGDAT